MPVFWRPKKDTYLFLPINGAGLGHVSRSLAIAKELQRQKPEAQIVFLTTSIGVHLVYREGFVCHHVPPAALIGTGVGTVGWNRLFYQCLVNVLSTHKPGTLIFDGSAPYLGLQRLMGRMRSVHFVWIKRGLYKANVDLQRIHEMVSLFDEVIVPSEFGDDSQQSGLASHVRVVAPVVGMRRQELLSGEEVGRRLRLDVTRPRVYVQLGAGNINGISDLQKLVVNLLKGLGYQVVVGQSPIALRVANCNEADREIVDYPNSRYFAGFSFAVLAAGYNSVCESVGLRLPVILLPNHATQADDQVQRAKLAATMGPCEVVDNFSEKAFLEAVTRLVQCIDAGKVFPDEERNGAVDAAKIIAHRK